MEEYKNCPVYQKTEADMSEYMRQVKEAEDIIRGDMNALGLKPDNMRMKVRNAAAQMVKVDRIAFEALRYPLTQEKVSREGNVTLVTNPIHEMERTARATLDAMLAGLGLIVKPDKTETRAGESQSASSPLDDVLDD